MAYYIYKDKVGQYRWHLKAANGKIIADSGEAYWHESDCLAAIQLVKNSGAAPVYKTY